MLRFLAILGYIRDCRSELAICVARFLLFLCKLAVCDSEPEISSKNIILCVEVNSICICKFISIFGTESLHFDTFFYVVSKYIIREQYGHPTLYFITYALWLIVAVLLAYL